MIFTVTLLFLRFESRVRFNRLHKGLGTRKKGEIIQCVYWGEGATMGLPKEASSIHFILSFPQGVNLPPPVHILLFYRSHLVIFFASKGDNLL